MLKGQTHITVALSGGADSVCCLHFLREMSKTQGFTLSAAHFHHQIRGQEADRDAEFCRALCRQWGIPLVMGKGDVPARAKENKESIEEAARVMRYHFFTKIGGVIATAHTADDNLETVLTNLVRGTGLRGLCGIPPTRNQFIRPILCMTADEVLTYLAEHNLPHVEDSTNGDLKSLRSRLRNMVIPQLTVENHSIGMKALEMTARLREDEAFLTNLATNHLKAATLEEGLDLKVLKQAPRPIFHRCLLLYLNQLGVQKVTAGHVSGLEKLIFSQQPNATLNLPKLTILRQYDKLLPQDAPNITFEAQTLAMPFVLPLANIGTFFCSETKPNRPHMAISQDKIGEKITVRPRQVGDELTFSGGTKSVKKRMIDLKIPTNLRDGLPVLESDGDVVAVWKVGIDLEFLPQQDDKCWYFYFQ